MTGAAPHKGKPRLLDLFCGAGGCTKGYQRAGFHVTGIDIREQPNYCGDSFWRGDALDFLATADFVAQFDCVHASPPCQAYSAGARMRNGYAKEHPRLIEPVRELLAKAGFSYVIENVPEAPLREPIILCGSTFGISAIEGVRRHRAFESNVPLMAPRCVHGVHEVVIGVYGDHPEDSVIRKGHPARRARDVAQAQHVMGIDWTDSWAELKEAIPPAYTELIGHQLLAHITERTAA